MKFYEIIQAPTPQELEDLVKQFVEDSHLKWLPCGGPATDGGVWIQALYSP